VAASSSFPPPPWRLAGPAAVAGGLLPLHAARRALPGGLSVRPVTPGHAVAALVLVRYGEGSVLSYSELGLLVGPVAGAGRLGGWVQGMWVDSEASRAGGRAIWGVPKELARFEWLEDGRSRAVTVRDEAGALLLRASWRRPAATIPLRATSAFFGALEGPLRRGPMGGRFPGAPARMTVGAPSDGPVAALGLARRLPGWAGDFDGATGRALVTPRARA
jgi:Acetoacetate decarboxylase (ADC)